MRWLLALLFLVLPIMAGANGFQDILQDQRAGIEKPSRKTVDGVLAALFESGDPAVQPFLERWQSKEVWQRKADGLFFFGAEGPDKTVILTDPGTGEEVATLPKKEVKQLKPNSGVRGVIASALVRFQLLDPSPGAAWCGAHCDRAGPG